MIGDIQIRVDGRELRGAVQKIESDLIRLTENPAIKTSIHQKWADLIEPWVPIRSGNLRGSTVIDENGIEYTASSPYNGYHYSGLQYYETGFNHKGITTDHWAAVAKPYVWDSLIDYASKEMKRGIKNNG